MAAGGEESQSELLRRYLDRLPRALAYWDQEQRCRFANEAAARLVGFARADLAGREMREVLGESAYAEIAGHVGAALRGEPQQFERVLVDASGRRSQPTRIAYVPDIVDGTVRGFFVVMTDLTVERRLEQERAELREALALERERRLFTQLLDAMPIATLVLDDDAIIRSANPAAAALFGYGPGELLGLSSARLLPERSRAGHVDRHRRFMLRERPTTLEAIVLRKDGRVVPAELRCGRVELAGEARLVLAVTDLLERDRLERRLRIASDASPAALLIVDGAGRVRLANAQATEMFGYDSPELAGMSVDELLPEELEAAHAAHRAAFWREPRARPVAARGGLRARRKGGEIFAVEVGLNPVPDAEGPLVLVAIVDVTERMRQRAELEQTNASLARSNVELERFAYVASHDLQTPLRTIGGFLDLVRSEYGARLDARGRGFVDRAVQATLQLRDMIEGLLAVSRVESHASTLSAFALGEAVARARALLDTAIEESGATFEVSPALPEVRGDLAQIAQLFQNLFVNALTYRSHPAPTIRVGVLPDAGEGPRFFVEDDGPGIAKADHEVIFELFRRLPAARDHAGNGIGLAVCRRIVTRHGGRIWVESEGAGRGSRFVFTLPGIPAGA